MSSPGSPDASAEPPGSSGSSPGRLAPASGPVRLVQDLGPRHVGRRVVVRHRTGSSGDSDGGHADVVGVLESWDGGELRLRVADGSVVTVAEADIAGGKPVPAPVETRTSPERLQEVAAQGWRAVESDWLGRWWLRAAEGFTGRANAVLPLGDPGVPLDDALDRVRRWYGERGLPPTAMVVIGSGIDADLERRGWEMTAPSFSHRDVMVQTAMLSTVLPRLAERSDPVTAVALADEADEAWLSRYRSGGLPPVARRVLAHPKARFASVRVEGELAAIGRCVLGRRWAGLSAIEVSPAFRRRGLATAVVAALLRDAAERGARASYLQVTVENDAALPLYARLGYATHHRYCYRREP